MPSKPTPTPPNKAATFGSPAPPGASTTNPGSKETTQIAMYAVKITGIMYVACIYLTLAFVLGILVDHWWGEFDTIKADQMPLWQLYFQVLIQFSVIGVLIYTSRNIVAAIPFPLDGMYGFNHQRLKELQSGAFFGTIFFMFQSHLKNKLMYIARRINNYWINKK